ISNSTAPPSLTDDSSEQKINSLFGTGSLSYNSYVFLNFSGRNDWASVLPQQNSSIFYPSASLSLLVDDMFNIESENIDLIKLRGSWAQTGSTGPLAAYSINPSYTLSDPINGETPTAAYPNTAWNSDIKAQMETSIEAGLELRLFDNRLHFDVTYYDKKNEDVIMPLQVPSASGFTNVWQNAATITNKGIEAFLNAEIIRSSSDGFNLGVDINFAKNTNEVSDVDGSGVINLDYGN